MIDCDIIMDQVKLWVLDTHPQAEIISATIVDATIHVVLACGRNLVYLWPGGELVNGC